MHLAGTLIFAVSYAVFALGHIPFTRIDRTRMAVLGGTLMVALGIVEPREALEAIDFPTLVLLFTMMLVAAALEESGFFRWLEQLVLTRVTPRHLLPAIIFSSGILSALLVNDVVCVILTPLAVRLAHAMRRPLVPCLLALATAANIGSVATMIGNPQNILIASVAHLGYANFLLHLGPVALLGLFADWAILAFIFRREFQSDEAAMPSESAVPDEMEMMPAGFTPGMLWPLIVTAGVAIGMLAGVPPALASSGAAALLMVTVPTKSKKDGLLAHIDLGLIVFFVGLFLILAGGESSGVNGWLLAKAELLNLSNAAIFTVIVTALANIVSNVPAVMLLRPYIASHGNAESTWLILAMVSTLAGNLTITGSVANIIVAESARGESAQSPIGFWQYPKAGVPITVLTLVIGWLWFQLLR